MNPHFRIFDKSDNKFISINTDNYTVNYQGDCLLLSPMSKFLKYFPFINILDNENFVIQHNTGLKDKNGSEIYEGDIVKNKYNINYKINWTDWVGQIMFDSKESVLDLTQVIPDEELEIIGNIFENPPLLI